MLTYGSHAKIVFSKTKDYDKKLNFEQSIGYTSDSAALKSP
jgi:hypothetical protein